MTDSSAVAPRWLHKLVGLPTISYKCVSDGACIHYRCWNAQDEEKPGLVFVHGYRAHSHWWDFIAPFFTNKFRVYALDLSGMGQSGYRPEYSFDTFSNDIVSVLKDAKVVPATLVGHSFGGGRVLRLCADIPQVVAQAVLIDAKIRYPNEEPTFLNAPVRATGYGDKSSILARYRLVPEQPVESFLRSYVAEHSIKWEDGRWRWRFDPHLTVLGSEKDGLSIVAGLKKPLRYIYGGRSAVVSDERAFRIHAALPQKYKYAPIRIAGAHHHIMLDQPRALINELKAIL